MCAELVKLGLEFVDPLFENLGSCAIPERFVAKPKHFASQRSGIRSVDRIGGRGQWHGRRLPLQRVGGRLEASPVNLGTDGRGSEWPTPIGVARSETVRVAPAVARVVGSVMTGVVPGVDDFAPPADEALPLPRLNDGLPACALVAVSYTHLTLPTILRV